MYEQDGVEQKTMSTKLDTTSKWEGALKYIQRPGEVFLHNPTP